MNLAEPFNTLFEKYYGFIYLYLNWYTKDPTLINEILTKSFVQYILTTDGKPVFPIVRLQQIAREIAIALTKDARPTLEETQRRRQLFAFLGPISDEDRDVYLERFYRNASDMDLSIHFKIPVHAVQEKIRKIAKIHGQHLDKIS